MSWWMQLCRCEEVALVVISNDYNEGCGRVEQFVDASVANPQNEPSKRYREVDKKIHFYGILGANVQGT